MNNERTKRERKIALAAGKDLEKGIELTLRKKDDRHLTVHINERQGTFVTEEEPGLNVASTAHLPDKMLLETEKCLKDLLNQSKLTKPSVNKLMDAFKKTNQWQIFRERHNGREAWDNLKSSFKEHLQHSEGLHSSPYGIVYITGGKDLMLGSVCDFTHWVQETLGRETSLFVGCTMDDSWQQNIEVFMLMAES